MLNHLSFYKHLQDHRLLVSLILPSLFRCSLHCHQVKALLLDKAHDAGHPRLPLREARVFLPLVHRRETYVPRAKPYRRGIESYGSCRNGDSQKNSTRCLCHRLLQFDELRARLAVRVGPCEAVAPTKAAERHRATLRRDVESRLPFVVD